MSGRQDREKIRAHLQEQFGLSMEQIDDLLPLFLKTLNGYLAEVEAALTSADLKLLCRRAHTMKGALLNLGLHDGAELAKEIESKTRTGDKNHDYVLMVARLRAGLDDYLD